MRLQGTSFNSSRDLVRLQPEIIVSKLWQHPALMAPESNSEPYIEGPRVSWGARQGSRIVWMRSWGSPGSLGVFHYGKRKRISRRGFLGRPVRGEVIDELVVFYHGPTWLTTRAWRIWILRASSGWTFCPRTYNVIPFDSLLFRYARTGDTKGIQDLFANKKASPFDCSSNDYTPLHVSTPLGKNYRES